VTYSFRPISTSRLVLRPLHMSDVPALAAIIFSDHEVVKGLAHDISDFRARTNFAEVWCRNLAVDGGSTVWRDGGLGGYAITFRSESSAPPDDFLGVIGIYDAEKRGGRWNGELLYALGSSYHGQGIATEASQGLMSAFQGLVDAGELWACYWTVLNPESGRILGRLGFLDDGTPDLVDIYEPERAATLPRFEIWRLERTPTDRLRAAASEAAIKLGHLSAAGVISKGYGLARIEAAVGDRISYDTLRAEIASAFDFGVASPAITSMRYTASS
jgi:RimJ/RimL family protein N-acetyltransferase